MTGPKRAPPSILLCCACPSAGPAVLAGWRAPSKPWWGPWQPRPCPLEPVPRRYKRRWAGVAARAARPKRQDRPPEASALRWLNRSGCVGYNERVTRLQQERPPLTTSTSLLVFDRALACDRSPFARSDITAGNITSSTRIQRWLRWRRPH